MDGYFESPVRHGAKPFAFIACGMISHSVFVRRGSRASWISTFSTNEHFKSSRCWLALFEPSGTIIVRVRLYS